MERKIFNLAITVTSISLWHIMFIGNYDTCLKIKIPELPRMCWILQFLNKDEQLDSYLDVIMSKFRMLCSCKHIGYKLKYTQTYTYTWDTSKCSLLRGKFGFACPVVRTGYKAMMLVARNMVLFCTIYGITSCIATFYWVKQRSKRWHKKPSEGFPSAVNFSTHEDSRSTSESSNFHSYLM